MDVPLSESRIEPVKLEPGSRFTFACHKGLPCFTRCCYGIDIILTPYDILRMKQRLGLSADDFLVAYTTLEILEKTQLPVPRLRMQEDGGCPFVTPKGCSIYEDRPATCRYYPLGMAVLKKQDLPEKENFYFMIREAHCLGWGESKRWTVAEWRADQGVDLYDEVNRGWMDFVIRKRSLGPQAQLSEKALRLFFMVSTNVERFRRFVFESRFLSLYEVPPSRVEQLRTDDVALLRFGMEWLESVFFGVPHVRLRPGVQGARQGSTDAGKSER